MFLWGWKVWINRWINAEEKCIYTSQTKAGCHGVSHQCLEVHATNLKTNDFSYCSHGYVYMIIKIVYSQFFAFSKEAWVLPETETLDSTSVFPLFVCLFLFTALESSWIYLFIFYFLSSSSYMLIIRRSHSILNRLKLKWKCLPACLDKNRLKPFSSSQVKKSLENVKLLQQVPIPNRQSGPLFNILPWGLHWEA